MPKTSQPNRRLFQPLVSCFSALTAGTLFTATALAGDYTKDMAKPMVDEPLRIHALVSLEFSTDYITPRGVHVENQGLVFQPLFLAFTTLYDNKDKDAFLSNVGMTTGVWNSLHERRSGAQPGNLNETDPIFGLTFKLAKGFEFDATYSGFYSQTNSYETCHNLSLKLTYNDKWFGDQFSINPYVEYWRELAGKATVVLDPNTSTESWYFSIGINPTYKFKAIPLEISLPTYFNVVENDFYQRFDGTPGGGGVAVISTELKATYQLNAIPAKYGHWSLYAGYQYYHLDNPGLLDGNQALDATSERLHNLWQVHGGLSVFF